MGGVRREMKGRDKGGEGNIYALPWIKSCGRPPMLTFSSNFSIK